jgi:hypothetical protein
MGIFSGRLKLAGRIKFGEKLQKKLEVSGRV